MTGINDWNIFDYKFLEDFNFKWIFDFFESVLIQDRWALLVHFSIVEEVFWWGG